MGRLTSSYSTGSQQQGQPLVGLGDLSSEKDFEKFLTHIKLYPHATYLFDARARASGGIKQTEKGLEFVIVVQGASPKEKRDLLLRFANFFEGNKDWWTTGENVSFITHPNHSKKILRSVSVKDDIGRLPGNTAYLGDPHIVLKNLLN